MNILSLENIRSWFGLSHTAGRVEFRVQEDVYVTRVIESLNYCKSHPNASKCENLLIQG